MSIYFKTDLAGLSNSTTDPTGKDTSKLSVNGLPRGPITDTAINGTEPLYEWLMPNKHTRPYFDVDYQCTDEAEYTQLTTDNALLNQAVKLIGDTFDVAQDDMRISSYNGVEKSHDRGKHVKKYGQHLVSYHIVIKNRRTTITANKEMAKVLHAKDSHFDIAPYGCNQLFRVAGHHKHKKRDAHCRVPKLMYYDHNGVWCNVKPAQKTVNGTPTLDFKYEHVINITHPDDAFMEDDPEVIYSDDEDTEIVAHADLPAIELPIVAHDDALTELLSYVPDTDRDDRNKWWYIAKCIKSFNDTPEAYATFDDWSKGSPKYDAVDNRKIWDSITKLFDNGQQRLRKKADLIQRVHKAYASADDEEMCNLFIHLYSKYFKVVNYPKMLYMFDKQDTLWKQINKDFLNTFLTEHFAPLRDTYLKLLNKKPDMFLGTLTLPDDADERKAMEKERDTQIKQIVSAIKTSKCTKRKCDYQKEFFTRASLQDVNFLSTLNSNPDILSCNNGVLEFPQMTFRERRYDDYLSKSLELDYEPTINADEHNEDFIQFIHDIFDAEELDAEAIMRYIQCFLGYGITGKNTEQKCLILFGAGSNGKSLLNDLLYVVLKCTAGKMVDTFNSNLFDDVSSKKESANQASPERAKLVDCNIGLVNESSEGLMFGEMFKKFIDNPQSLSYREMYCTSQALRLITKFLMSTNNFPNFPVEECFTRRIDTIPMLKRFTDTPTLPNDAKKDTQLFDKMTNSMKKQQAILNWLIAGAKMYYDNKCHIYPLPKCCIKFKQHHVDNNDWTLLFNKTESAKDVMPFDEIYETINSQMTRKDLTKAVVGRKLEELGYTKKRKTVQGRKIQVFTNIVPANIDDEEEEEQTYAFNS